MPLAPTQEQAAWDLEYQRCIVLFCNAARLVRILTYGQGLKACDLQPAWPPSGNMNTEFQPVRKPHDLPIWPAARKLRGERGGVLTAEYCTGPQRGRPSGVGIRTLVGPHVSPASSETAQYML